MTTLFKEKNNVKKKKKRDFRITLDAKHENKKKYFQDKINTIKIKYDLLEKNKNELKELNSIKRDKLTDIQLENLFSLKEKILNLEKDIKEIEKNNEEINYLLNTGTLLFQYYENIEKIAQGIKPKKNEIKKQNIKPISVIDFFNFTKNNNIQLNIKKKESINENINQDINQDINENININNNNNINIKDKNNFINEDIYQSRQKIVNKYDNIIDNIYFENKNEINQEICSNCGLDKYLVQGTASLVCKKCGDTDFVLIDSEKPSYKDPPKEISYFAYKRINHFNEWLAQFQAKETTDIPEEVYEKVILEIKKERIDNMISLKQMKVRNILKKLKFNKYYEHVPHIINKLNGIPAPIMTRETEEKLRNMFKEIQTPFIKYCPKDRKNFLSYSYVLHKFCQLLNLDEFLICFPLLKSREKLHQQDNIWKQICLDLKWEFIKSL